LVPITTLSQQELKITATDTEGLTASANFFLTFISKPYLGTPLQNYQIRTDKAFSCAIPRNTFIHPNGDTIRISVDQVPSWLTFSPSELSFSGTPSSLNVGTYQVIVSGTDSKNESTATSFEIDVQKNYVPVVQKQLDDQQIELNVSYTLRLDRDTFVDPNADNLTYSIVGRLPSWLQFDAGQLQLNGTPREYGRYNVSVMARDAWNASAVMTFEIVAGIQPNAPPIVTL
jgi:Putative Ig domain